MFNKEFWDKVEEQIELGNISKNKHPELDLFVLCYTKNCVIERCWNEATMACRGMVIDGDNNIISLPIKKFFNDDQLVQMNIKVPLCSFTVYEKLDGSIIYMSKYKGQLIFNSKSSFISEHAGWAKELFFEKYTESNIEDHITFCFELIVPQNRIVIDYKDRRELVLITGIDKNTGEELDILYPYFSKPKRYDGLNDVKKIKEQFNHLKGSEFEGFVIKFDNNFRMKIKLDPYLKLHRTLSGINERLIWEMLKNGESFEAYNELEDDDIKDWITKTKERLEDDFVKIRIIGLEVLIDLMNKTSDQKSFAQELIKMKCPYQNVVFSMYHKKNADKIIWDYLYPKGNITYKIIKED